MSKIITNKALSQDVMIKTAPFYSKVYTDRPAYADFDAPHKFEAIKSIIAKRLIEHPNAICSYSGGSDSDIMLHLIETVRKMFNLPPVQYCFFNTGLEMKAIRQHVREMEKLYGVTITEYRPKKNIVIATRERGIPFMSKIVSAGLEGVQKKNIPLSIAKEYAEAVDKISKRSELRERYPKCESSINFLCGCNSNGDPRPEIQLVIGSSKYLLDFIIENPIPFRVSNKCCDYCKKQVAHSAQKTFDMAITGERRDEGGCDLYHEKITRRCALPRPQTASIGSALFFMYRTQISSGIKTTTKSAIRTHTRCTA